MAYNQMQTRQSGSVVSFLLVGVVLVGLVAGGIYVLQKRSNDTPPDSPATTHKPAEPSSTSDKKPEKTPAKTSPSSTPKQTPSKSAAPSPVPGAATIPDTGPSDIIPAGTMFAVLFGTTIAYVQSRKAYTNFNRR